MTILSVELGATLPVGNEQVTLFIPSKDQIGQTIDQNYWTDQALATLGRLFRGATAFPPGKGVWRNDARGGELVYEPIVMVTSFVPIDELMNHMGQLKTFLHRLGREANQGEVGIVVGGCYHGITTFAI